LLESNTTLGLANKFLANFVDYVGVQFNSIRHKKSILVGNPIKIYKPNFDHPWFYKGEKVILFVGGSNGAFDIVKMSYEFNLKYPGVKIIVITGNHYYNTFVFNKNAAVFKKIFELSSVLNKFDLVVSRAGASTITELLLSNTPFILVPSPNVSGNHQVYNAKYLEEQGVREVIYDINFEQNIAFIYKVLFDKNKLENMKNNQRIIQIKDSLRRVYDLIEKD
jgi:UDP-N-acetylglucosamine--N-acetylmuramyl-(pentapeptide) pyrophosphoryl-undecaprenol N-acetylglucosamine transferase